MALRTADDDPTLNPGQQHSDNQFNDLKKAESNGTAGSNNDDSGGSDNVKNAEENPSGDWQNNVSGDKPATSGRRFGFVKKKGPLTAIILTVVGGSIGIGGLLSPALLTQSILANLVQKFNLQETSMTMRANKLLVSKLAGNATQGICKPITIMCKFTRPSNRFLSQLEKNGIKAVGSGSSTVEKNLLFPNTRPKSYEFTDSAGKKITATAEELSSKLLDNAEFRAAFHKASNSRFMSLTDSVFTSIKNKFGFNITDKLKSAKSEEDLTKKVGNELEAEGSAAKALAKGEKGAEVEIKNLLEKEVETTSKKLAKSGKGGLVGLVAGGVCLVADAPKLITKAVRAFQMAQLIKYSMVFLSAFGAIKAGDATPAEASTIGDELTKIGSNGKSAMDSFGMNNAINSTTKPSTDDYKQFIPANKITSNLGSYNKVVSGAVKTNTCKVTTSIEFGAAVDVALSGTTLVGGVINIAAGYALGEVIAMVAPPIIKAITEVIPTEKILGWFLNDLTKDINGEQVGDALASGASHVMGQAANAGGNMPLSVDDAVAYNGLTKQVQLAYAEEDRATLSPFDISSPNTMLGSIVQKLIPYYTSASSGVGSITHSLSFIGNLVMGSFGAALQPLTAGAESADTNQYQLCQDPMLEDVAAGPYCNIIYGVPIEYLDKSPTDVLQALGNDNVDQYTGNPVEGSDLEAWVASCTDGTTDAAEGCKITDKKTANYALYTIDHRIQQSLDGPDTTAATTVESTQ
ncbi:hypothetical protein COV88_00500 [Candidatus Saccharibacteria bacterium CG11_big_fil_rev_8_21_14_0_20_41_19]|nr:hypothetical protein [Candidatus Saccharibacteria bacterium]OIP85481.1 MAG: hypothetical protein AUK57_04175 [Candidatus Saccharibacteria bacterium CG2_30_41_52]PIQ71262.1 MAG: hypothetical protein COV88_00500 [Candidatus Saccharibacteria bacterium CG11_big_fil_rev_8_21_14_0_20_41_19]PJC29622.1 MAG: hypothetical protein CO052_02380 [Candidatus Saccharibacteria bacterium CG_4_9_14_0_2_um_filter_41_9]PJE66483.1 MAG: hypothetical protein COU92_00625 [Candidatus Saccharibacteria bacterium CG10_b